MKTRSIVLLSIALLLLSIGLHAVQKDDPKCKDHPLFNRLPDYWIHHCILKQFDAYEFPVAKGKSETVEGQYWQIVYFLQPDLASKPSQLQVQRNYEGAIQKQGGAVVYSEKGRSTLKLPKEGKETWVDLKVDWTGSIFMTIVQKEAMEQEVVANSAAMNNDINATGHVAVYGIYFDSGKSLIKAESAQAIGEIAKLLKSQPALKLFVVGHTDNQGTVDGNIQLAQDRAEAVLKALVGGQGIAAARLRAFGCGQFAPVASNDADEGRAKNRRVELVKQ